MTLFKSIYHTQFTKLYEIRNSMSPYHIWQHLVIKFSTHKKKSPIHSNDILRKQCGLTHRSWLNITFKSLYEESAYSPDVDAWSPWLLDTVNRYDDEDDAEDEALDLVHRWCWSDVRLELLLPCSLGLKE